MSEHFTRPNIEKVIGTLGTTPEQRGLSTQEFKDKFDKMPEAIQQYIKETLLIELDAFKQEFMTHQADYANFKGLQMLSTNYTDDYDDLPNGSVVRTLGTMAINGPFPECFTWTLGAGTHGVQLSCRYTQNMVAYRRKRSGTWLDWVEVSLGGNITSTDTEANYLLDLDYRLSMQELGI